MLPRPSAGQVTVTGGAVAWRGVGRPRKFPVAVKVAGPADSGGVACTASVNVVTSSRFIVTEVCVLLAAR